MPTLAELLQGKNTILEEEINENFETLEKERKLLKEYRKFLTERNKELVKLYKEGKICNVCKQEKELTFHHRNPQEKRKEICDMVCQRYDFFTLVKEISKCDLLCKECHYMVEYYISKSKGE